MPELGSILYLNNQTMHFIDTLQKSGTSLATTACLNILSHPAGAVHMKMAVVGSETETFGFTGGMDLVPDRHESWWHDVAAMVTGPAVQNFIEAFGKMWTEIKGRSPVSLSLPEIPRDAAHIAAPVTCASHTEAMPPFIPPTVINTSAHKCRVQSVRTLPQFHFASAPVLAWITGNTLPKNDPLTYAPDGLTEVKQVWQKAIGDAYLYIYIEDQGFTSTAVFDWINAALKANAALRVVLLVGKRDPNDAPNGLDEKIFNITANHLVRGLDAAQKARIGYFSHQEKFVHTKSTIIDDQWAIIGSANCFRRSLYSDFEHSVSFMDNDNLAVPAYRKDLWGRHVGAIEDIQAALDAWFALPYKSNAPDATIVRLPLPLPDATLSKSEQWIYDEVNDVDSRQPWGSGLYELGREKVPGWADALIVGICAVALGAVGAVVGALVGGPVGAIVGGAAGALIGAGLGSLL